MVHARDPSIWEVETEGSEIQDHAWQYAESNAKLEYRGLGYTDLEDTDLGYRSLAYIDLGHKDLGSKT